MRTRRVFIAVVLVCSSSFAAIAQQPEKSPGTPVTDQEKYQREFSERVQKESAAAKRREADIDAELRAMDRAVLKDDDWAKEWSGTYCSGDGVTIKLSPKAGLIYSKTDCFGLRDLNHGDIKVIAKDGLSVQLAIPEAASPHSYMSSRLYFVRWGKRQYLVPEAQAVKFVNNFNKGGDIRNAMVDIPRRFDGGFHALPDEQAEAGVPQLPSPYAEKIIKQPMVLKVAKVRARQNPTISSVPEFDLELEGGKALGVFSGMEIDYDGVSGYGPVSISRVDGATSRGWLRLYTGGTKGPSVGDVLKLPGVSNSLSKTAPSPK